MSETAAPEVPRRRPQRARRARRPRGRFGPWGVLVVLMCAGLVLGACSDAPPQDRGAAGESAGPVEDDASREDTGADAPTTDRVAAAVAGQDLTEGRMIARDASLALQVNDVRQGAARVRAAAAAADGYLVHEELVPGTDQAVRAYATVVVSVPSSRLDQVLDRLEEVGEVTERGMSSTDVTADYVDTTARRASLEASVERTRELMAEAESIADVVALERELSTREADLDALTAHAASLEDQVARSTVTVSLTEAADTQVAEAAGGFLHGLARGWDAFTAAGAVALTALGAVLPFALLAAVVLLPAWAWRRTRTRRGTRAQSALPG